MRGLADAERLRRFLRELAREAAAEVAVGLGLIVAIFRHRESTAVDDLSELRG